MGSVDALDNDDECDVFFFLTSVSMICTLRGSFVDSFSPLDDEGQRCSSVVVCRLMLPKHLSMSKRTAGSPFGIVFTSV